MIKIKPEDYSQIWTRSSYGELASKLFIDQFKIHPCEHLVGCVIPDQEIYKYLNKDCKEKHYTYRGTKGSVIGFVIVKKNGLIIYGENTRPEMTYHESNKIEEALNTSTSMINVGVLFKSGEEGKAQLIINQIEKIQDKLSKKKNTESNVGIIVNKFNDFQLQNFDLKNVSKTIKPNYNKKIVDFFGKLKKDLAEDYKGLFLFHGPPGTGKTSFIKILAHNVPNKQFIFVPPGMADFLTSPQFIPFLEKHKNSVLVIEDGEQVIASRDRSNSQAVSNLLNITDGILSDFLGIQIICTFNTDQKNIDKALMRKGRAKMILEFDDLEVDKANALLKKLKHDHTTDEPMALADIYNFDEEDFEDTEPERQTVGFNLS